MKEIETVHARLKHVPEDFVVEETGPEWQCSIKKEKFETKEIPEKPEGRNYLCFEVVKRDIDHFIAMKTLSKQLKKSLQYISYAGTKDKKAVTSQRVSVFDPNIELVKTFSSEFMFLKNFKWEKRKIKLGYLEGNKFTVTLRDIDAKSAMKISNAIRKRNYFENYFGPQRFGSVRKNNDKIGNMILKGAYEQAVMTILTDTSVEEKPDIMKARRELAKTKDFKAALKYFPENLKLERGILLSLKKKEGDFLNAIKRIEKRYSLMLVQAVQSRLFNEILRRAIEEGIDLRKKGQQNVPLIGYKTKFSGGRLGEIEREALEKYGLKQKDFDLRKIPHLRLKGSYRKALVEVMNLDVEVEEDEMFRGAKKITLQFTLPSGVYATTYLEQYFEFE